MTISNKIWRNWDFIDWMKGLGILGLPWIRPFLPSLGVPQKLVVQPELWADLYKLARESYLENSIDWEGMEDSEDKILVDQYLNWGILDHSFEQLLLRTDEQTVMDFCQWHDRNFCNHQYDVMVNQWHQVLMSMMRRSEDFSLDNQYLRLFKNLLPRLLEMVWSNPEKSRYQLLKIPISFELSLPAHLLEGDNDLQYMLELTSHPESFGCREHDILLGDTGIVEAVIHKQCIRDFLRLLECDPQLTEQLAYFRIIAKELDHVNLNFFNQNAFQQILSY
jgi:hypothetical protein